MNAKQIGNKEKGIQIAKEYYIPCYNITYNEIYFTEFFTEKTISPTTQENARTSNLDLMSMEMNYKAIEDQEKSIDEQIKECLAKFQDNWKKMKVLSRFNDKASLPERIKDYFKRPFYSKFFLGEKRDLFSFNNCVPLPNVLGRYDTIHITVIFHIESIFDLIPNSQLKDPRLDNIENILIPIEKNIPFQYIIDTLIKDCLKELFMKISDELKRDLDLDLRNGFKFVLKRAEFEEYLYGDYTIGSYDFIRGYVRQHEGIVLLLKKIPFHKIQPPVFSFPPIIAIDENEVSYDSLMLLYLRRYPEKSIIYRYDIPDKHHIDHYLKHPKERVEHLTQFAESGDCDFPFMFKIIKLSHLNNLKDWIEDPIYNQNQMLLPYFREYPTKEQVESKGFMNKVKEKVFCFGARDKKVAKEVSVENERKEKEKQKKDNEVQKSKKNQRDEFEKNTKIEKEQFSFLQTEEKHPYDYLKAKKSISNQKVEGFMKIISIQKEKEREEQEEMNKNKEANAISPLQQQAIQGNLTEVEIQLQDVKYKQYKLKERILPFLPRFIRINISLLFGSYKLHSFRTEPFLLSDNVLINDRVLLDPHNCLISHLPFETRIGITLEAYDSNLDKNIILASGQIPLYKDNGQMQTDSINFELWPNVEIFPRVNCTTPFSLIYDPDPKPKHNKLLFGNYDNKINDENEATKQRLLDGNFIENLSSDFYIVQQLFFQEEIDREQKLKEKEEEKLREQEKAKEDKEKKEKGLRDKDKERDRDRDKEKEKEKEKEKIKKLKEQIEEKKKKEIEEQKQNQRRERKECSITLEFPNFAAPIVHSLKSSQSYRNFLEIKYDGVNSTDDFREIRKLFGNSQLDLQSIIKEFQKKDTTESDEIIENLIENKKVKAMKEKGAEIEYPTDIWDYLKKSLPKIVQILKKDPLEKLLEQDIVVILVCRDYISTIPSALELFLRAIDWRNPLETSIAHLYLKKWTPIEGEDAVSLLDARFPDSSVREYAVSILRKLPDDLISLYMLQLCQCLLYESFLVNPLSDFLIERSLMNPKLIGNSFFWNSSVSMNNPLFAERLSIYILQLFMICGENFLYHIHKGVLLNYHLEIMTYYAKQCYAQESSKEKKKAKGAEGVIKVSNLYNSSGLYKKFVLPIDPTYLGVSFNQSAGVFNSKMVPVLLIIDTREAPFTKKVIFKIGDDLRQDVLTLQILKIMDKLWLDKNLDLKVLPYKVLPTELKAGFIECVDGKELSEIQSNAGGALDREVIIKYLRGSNEVKTGNDQSKREDNFISSLAGYCVATCVIGIADRHCSNVMMKTNGIFFHIDFGHVLGKFKYKLGFKRERSLFLLTPEMVNVCTYANKDELFKQNCVDAFNILRHNSQRLMNLFIIMSTAGMPEVRGVNDIKYMKEMLKLDLKNDEDAGNYFIGQIRKCKNEKFRLIDNMIHNWKQ